MKYKKNLLNISILFIFIACQDRKQIGNDISSQKIRLREEIKKQTAKDLLKHGIKNILLYGDGRFGSTTEAYCFKENGDVIVAPYPSSGYKKGKFYWIVKNNELYINPNNYYFEGYKFIKMSVIPIEPGYYGEIKDLRRIKYSILIQHNDRALPLQINIKN